MHFAPMICPRVEDLAPFSQEIHKLSTKTLKCLRKTNLSTKGCSDVSELLEN